MEKVKVVRTPRNLSVSEVPHAREDHGQAAIIRGGNDFLITDGPAWLDDGRNPRICGCDEAICKGEKGVRRDNAAAHQRGVFLRRLRRIL